MSAFLRPVPKRLPANSPIASKPGGVAVPSKLHKGISILQVEHNVGAEWRFKECQRKQNNLITPFLKRINTRGENKIELLSGSCPRSEEKNYHRTEVIEQNLSLLHKFKNKKNHLLTTNKKDLI